MTEFQRYRRSQIAELAAWHPGFDMTGVSISLADQAAGSPKPGDMIARNPKNHADRWLVAEAYFRDNFEAIDTRMVLGFDVSAKGAANLKLTLIGMPTDKCTEYHAHPDTIAEMEDGMPEESLPLRIKGVPVLPDANLPLGYLEAVP